MVGKRFVVQESKDIYDLLELTPLTLAISFSISFDGCAVADF